MTTVADYNIRPNLQLRKRDRPNLGKMVLHTIQCQKPLILRYFKSNLIIVVTFSHKLKNKQIIYI